MIPFVDLIHGPRQRGMPWVAGGSDPAVGLDCMGLMRVIFERAGRPLPESSIWHHAETDEERRAAFREYLEGEDGAWDVVGSTGADADRLLDVVVNRNEQGRPHVSVVVQEKPCRAVTMDKEHGVLCLRPRMLRGVECVVRRRADR